ncbi:MAG: hypothetical protein ACFFCW_29465, partial [Candidatus Hodarchaeota archaeon]
MMSKNLPGGRRIYATLFPIAASPELEFNLRVLRVAGRMPEDAKRIERLNQLASELWRGKLKCPVKPFRAYKEPSLLVPEEKAHLADGYTFVGPGNKQRHLELTDEKIAVNLKEEDLDRREIVCDMLVRSFSDKFMSSKDK